MALGDYVKPYFRDKASAGDKQAINSLILNPLVEKLKEIDDWAAAVAHTVLSTNGNTYDAYPLGISYSDINSGNNTQSGQSDNTSFPKSNGILLTIHFSYWKFYQIFWGEDNGGHYERSFYNGTFEPWRRMDSDNITKTADFTLSLAEMNCFVMCEHATGLTVTVPANSSVPFPVNADITLCQMGDGQITVQPASDVTIYADEYVHDATDETFKSQLKYTAFTLRKIGTDTWVAIGTLATDE